MFRLGFRRLMEPLAQYLEERIEALLPILREELRPPGAIREKEFLATCYRCGNCVDVCPAKAIRTLSCDQVDRTGTPYIDPDLAACVVCDELACMKACPSGALKLVADRTDINMGLAVVSHERCIRTRGEPCTACIAKCPLGEAAIRLDASGRVEVRAAGCVGCGACQFYCPTTPKAITVSPNG